MEAEEDETTISGLAVEPNRSWTFQLLGDVTARAIRSQRTVEADKLLSRAAGELDAQIRQGAPLEDGGIDNLSSLAIQLAAQQGHSRWIEWILDIHRQLSRCMTDPIIDELESSGVMNRPEVQELVQGFIGWLERQKPAPTAATAARVTRLRTLTTSVAP